METNTASRGDLQEPRGARVAPLGAEWLLQDQGAELRKACFAGLGRLRAARTKVDEAGEAIRSEYEPGRNQSVYVAELKGRGIGQRSARAALESLVGREEFIVVPGQKDNEKLYYKPGDVPG